MVGSWRNLGTYWKIGITIGVIIVGILVLGVVSLFGSGSINKRVVNLYTQELVTLTVLNKVKGAMYRYRDRTLRYILDAGEEGAERHLNHLHGQKNRLREKLDVYKKTRLSAEETENLKGFEENWERFTAIVEGEVIPLVRRGELREAERVFFRKALPVFREARDNLNNLIAYQENRAQRRFQNANRIYSSVVSVTTVTIVAVVVLALLLMVNLIKSIRIPLSEIGSSILSLSEGDLTIKTKYKSKDEFGKTLEMFDDAVVSLNAAINEAKQVATENSNISDELAATTHQVSSNIEDMAKSIQVIRERGEEVIDTINTMNDKAVRSKDLIEKAMKELEETKTKMEEVSTAVKNVAQNELQLSERVNRLKEHSEKVRSIVKIISDIAEQTNVLSLNAAIEAARAGESGRGFSVVADEVRKLASRIQQSLEHIQGIIDTINEAVVSISSQMRKNSEAIMELSKFSEEVGRKFTLMSESMSTANLSYDEILRSFIENKSSIEEIIRQLKEIDQLAQANAKSVEEIAVATEQLRDITVELNKKLDRFTVH